jgi:DNA-binding transcriptional LysR family regulator
MDVDDLRVFEAVARLGAMNRAAVALNTVQSNVTARIRALEDELGQALFLRHGKGVSLTEAGGRLLPFARRLPALLNDAARAARDDGTPRGQLVIGSLETTAAMHLTPALAGFVKSHRAVDLTLQPGTTEELIVATRERRVEGAFVCGPVAQPDLREEAIFREELVALTAPDTASFDELARQADVRMVVLRTGCSYRHRLQVLLARRGIPQPSILEFGTLEAVLGCVSAGLGVTLLPRGMIRTPWTARRIRTHRLPPADAMVDTVFITPRDSTPSSALRAFLAQVAGQVVRRRVA